MKKTVIFMLLFYAFVAITGCNKDETSPSEPGITYDAKSINGRVTFADTNYFAYSDTTKGYYNISAFSTWPPMGPASANSKLTLKKEGGKYIADYKLTVPSNGTYVVTTAFIKIPYLPSGSVLGLGTYHCDTSHVVSCQLSSTPAKTAVITDNKGIGDINFLSWIDTTKMIYKF